MQPKLSLLKPFPFFQSPALQNNLLENSTVLTADTGDVIVRVGQYLKVLPLVISGSLRVFQQFDDREILLYYVQPGETCIMSLTSCFFNTESPTQAVAEQPTEILCVPANFVRQWQCGHGEWNDFIIRTFQGRYHELLTSFNSVVFNNIEGRLTRYLTDQSVKKSDDTIPLTHQALANELGTTRVVVSRILKNLEHNGKIKLQRAGIKIIKL